MEEINLVSPPHFKNIYAALIYSMSKVNNKSLKLNMNSFICNIGKYIKIYPIKLYQTWDPQKTA